MRYLISAFSLLVFHACWSQTSLPLPVEMPYNPDSIAAKRIAYIVVVEYNDYEFTGKVLTPGVRDSITFHTNGTIAEYWEKGLTDSAYARIQHTCDSLNAFYYTHCDSAGRVIECRSGSMSFHYRYNNKGDVVYSATIDRPVESADQVHIEKTTYDSLNRPAYIYSARGLLGYNYSTGRMDTNIRGDSYSRYEYANGHLVEIQDYLDSLTAPSTAFGINYVYSENKLVRVEVPTIHEHKQKKKQYTYIGRMWTVSYGYRE